MRADAVTSGSSASKSAAPRRRARGPRVRVVEAWVFTCRFRTYCHVLPGCGRPPVWSQCTATALATPVSYQSIAFTATGSYQGIALAILRVSLNQMPLPGLGHRPTLQRWPLETMLFRIADIQHAPRIALHVDRLMHRVAKDVRPRFAATAVQVRDPANIVLRFPEMRNTGAARHRPRASVVGRQAQADVAARAIQQSPSMSNPGVHVLLRVKRIGNIERTRGRGHQLDPPHRAFARNRIRIEIRFHLDHRAHQAWIHVVTGGRLVNRGVDILRGKSAVKSLVRLSSAVDGGVDFRSRRARRTHHRSARRNRLEAMFGHTPINQRGSGTRRSLCPRSSGGRSIPIRLILVNVDLAAEFVAGRSNSARPHT